MQTLEEKMREIETEWFPEHVSDSTAVLNFRKPGTSVYAVRYILDRNYLIITGDIGEAVFCLTEKAKLKSLAEEYSIPYLFGKLRADRDAYDFNSEKAIQKLESIFKDYEFDTNEEVEEFKELKEELYASIREECNSESQWAAILNSDYYDKISEYDQDCFEWIYSVGKEYSWQALGWVVGLKLAYKQLNEEKVKAI